MEVAHGPARVYVSWTLQWDLETYVMHYIRTRRLAPTQAERTRIAHCLGRYPRSAPLTKADLDFFLDTNLHRGVRGG
ncbi:MAG TPA: hypothetical protein VFE23_17635 [Usitatibacter sp.]|jgi:hypothetical protein|nr:hypothetical protein [Usitatibacter sp.]